MKTFALYTLTAILLLGLTTATFAQSMQVVDEDRPRAETRAMALLSMQRSPAVLQAQKDSMKQMMNSIWHGDGSSFMAMDFLQQEDFREGIGVSEEQFRKIQEVPQRIVEGPEFQQYRDEVQKLMSEDGGPFGENATEEMQNRFAELQLQMSARVRAVMMEGMVKAVNENLTPEQLKKVQEAQISTMSEIPIISPNIFEALGLSDAQRKQLDEIKKEMEPEFDKHVDKLVDAQMKMVEKMQETFAKANEITDPEERQKFFQNLQENVRKDNPDLQRAMNEVMESGKVFSDALKSRMFDVLTDAQWKRMVDLVDNPPEYMKKLMAEMRKQMGTDDPQARTGSPVAVTFPVPVHGNPVRVFPKGIGLNAIREAGFQEGKIEEVGCPFASDIIETADNVCEKTPQFHLCPFPHRQQKAPAIPMRPFAQILANLGSLGYSGVNTLWFVFFQHAAGSDNSCRASANSVACRNPAAGRTTRSPST